MTVTDSSMLSTLASLIDSLTTTTLAFRDNEDSFTPQPDGISLLDVKNDLLLSYLQNLVCLILFRLRNISEPVDGIQDLQQSVVKKLVELRVYLEKGVRPLEGKLKYQIDSVLRAVENAEASKATTGKTLKVKTAVNGQDEEASTADSDSDASEDTDAVPALLTTSHQSGPRLLQQLARIQPSSSSAPQATSFSRTTSSKDGIYKPPRVAPTTMPSDPDLRTRAPRKQPSQIMNEYVDEELSSTPFAQPSIGSNATILQGGRSGMSLKDREKERERTEYEEKHFTRLPGESKAERRKARARGEGVKRDVFGGEDWSGLGGLGERVRRSVNAGGREREGLLKRREKRRATEDGPRGDGRGEGGGGLGIGERFEKRRRVLEGREGKRRKR